MIMASKEKERKVVKNNRIWIICTALLVSLAVGLLSLSLLAIAAPVKIGDVDGDGFITASDRILLSRYIADWNDMGNIDEDAADIDRNGSITSLDRIILSRYLADWPDYSSYFEGNDPSAVSSNHSATESQSAPSSTFSQNSDIQYESDTSGWSSRWY